MFGSKRRTRRARAMSSGIPGRGTVVGVRKTPAGGLVECALTVGVRLADGTPSYRAACNVSVTPEQAMRFIPGHTFVTVRADPCDRARVTLSLDEPIPVITITDPAAIDPSVRALRHGAPCRLTVLVASRQWLQNPEGSEFHAIKVRLDDGSEAQIFSPVPARGRGAASGRRRAAGAEIDRRPERSGDRLGGRRGSASYRRRL